ncbi:MAG: hypothetical protein AAFX08_05720 [Pseudomonadota bacterium]
MSFEFRPPIGGPDALQPDFADARRALGGAYGWLTPHLAVIASVNADFARRVLIIDRAEAHFIALAVALMGPDGATPARVAGFGARLGRVSRDKALADAAPAAPRGLASLSGRLVGGVWRPATYRRLASLMDDPQAAKTLRHMKRVSRRDVRALSRLPDGYRVGAVVEVVARKGHLPTVLFAIDLVRRVRADVCDRDILASLKSMDPKDVGAWIDRHYEAAAFPAPPVAGDISVAGGGRLRALTNHREMVEAGQALSNCARTYAMATLKGEAYLYRYVVHRGHRDWPGAMAEVRRAPGAGWVAVSALGASNEPLRPVTRMALVAAFREAGFLVAPRLIDPNAPWLNCDFD